MKIKNVAIIIQNNVQFNSIENAIKIMQERNINVDILIPEYNDSSGGFQEMFNEFYNNIKNYNFNIYRKPTNKNYDILFYSYENPMFKNIKRKYTIKYLYGAATKPDFSMSLRTNFTFDALLCYGEEDAKILNNYGKTFKIGNIRYLNVKIDKEKKEKKKTILYLPTYSKDSSIELIFDELVKLKEKYNIIIKLHHGTEFLNDEIEIKRRNLLKENFDFIYTSKTPLEELFNKSDVVISDMSGAVFDAICLNIPVVMYCDQTKRNYGKYQSICNKYSKNGHIVSFNVLDNNLETLIKKACSKKQLEKEKELFNIMYACENKDTRVLFENFLDEIENGCIDEEYLQVHNQNKLEISKLYDYEAKYYIINDQYNNLQKEFEILKANHEILQKEKNALSAQLNNIYNKKIWKIISPFIKLKKVISHKND
jgi:O-antigen biosynthesis protein